MTNGSRNQGSSSGSRGKKTGASPKRALIVPAVNLSGLDDDDEAEEVVPFSLDGTSHGSASEPVAPPAAPTVPPQQAAPTYQPDERAEAASSLKEVAADRSSITAGHVVA
ncbi:hypothetical protein AB0N17_45195, partial [Streptomyces sp. NPDC051133]|uniref:hypothetical protein n=1 Tax=Streptomyces sp. NPDC051133 TaxID=3155521 RepID=UPI00343F6529